MIKFTTISSTAQTPEATLTLDFDARTKSRLKVALDDGRDAGLFLERGRILQDGDILSADTGETVQVKAAQESVSTVYEQDSKKLLLACYHLGNRHVSLQIGDNWVRYQHDHVLDDMIQFLGLTVTHETVPFSPESGAYQAGRHNHEHGKGGHNHVH